MGAHHADVPVPRGPLMAAGLLVAASIAGAAWVRLSGQPISAPEAAITAERALRFADRPDGSVEIIDVRTGRTVDRVQGEAGFVRGALRGLVRERKRRGIGDDVPLLLAAHADGRVTLADPATGQAIDLGSFGPDNAREFTRLLAARP